jgi:membrane protease YdiL (CAAX protease family)
LIGSFGPFLNLELLPGFFGLFLIGAVLCYAFQRTGTLYMSMGLHAGWILSLKTFGVFGRYAREDLGWMFGSTDPKVVSGVISWVGIMIVGVLVYRLTFGRSGLSSAGLAPDSAVNATTR